MQQTVMSYHLGSGADGCFAGFKGLALRSRQTSMMHALECDFNADDVEEWMWEIAGKRPGYWTISIPIRTGRNYWIACMKTDVEEVIIRKVNYSQKEYAEMEQVVWNQMCSETKTKVARPVIYQRSVTLWKTGSKDHVTMRTIGVWAMAQYKCQSNKFYEAAACFGFFPGKKFRSTLSYTVVQARVGGEDKGVTAPLEDIAPPADDNGQQELPGEDSSPAEREETPEKDETPAEHEEPAEETIPSAQQEQAEEDSTPAEASPKNLLGYQAAGAEYINEHPCGSVDAEDAEIRATVNGRIVERDAGIGVVGQSTVDENKKQICGVLSLPISVEPNVYAQECANAEIAIAERITASQRKFNGSEKDKGRIGRLVEAALNCKVHAPFSSSKILDTLDTLVYENIRSKKWTAERMVGTIERLCTEIQPTFKLKAAVKLEPMKENKAPRLLIADEDRGQVMSLLTIYVIEYLMKQHFSEKGIKGCSKKDAIKRVMESCRAPKNCERDGVSVFEGDGSAWDTTCSIEIRDLCENPVINRVAAIVNGFMSSSPASWANAHRDICCAKEFSIVYAKNHELKRFTIDSIRRSGHRGTSCLNWWVNFVCWHSAISSTPEKYLDPSVRKTIDVTGRRRWLSSAFEGDDSLLTTSPPIVEGSRLHSSILNFWHRIGFNMKIKICDRRALFVGYYIGIDRMGPVFDKGSDTWMMMPEIDRCFSRSGTSTSPAIIQAFKQGDRATCVKLSGSAALSRAFEFAGLSPTVSAKFLGYALECDFMMTHDLKMRTNADFEDKSELVSHIECLNGMCNNEDEILEATGFAITDQERATFIDYTWNYDKLKDWEGFGGSLPHRFMPS